VTPGSVAEELGLQPGDVVLTINNQPLRDILDFRFQTASSEFTMLVKRNDAQYILDVIMSDADSLGIEFYDVVFDGLRLCRNHCPFCFISQLPPGLRPSLYVRDDDYRYSFLYGNFITLTNLDEQDWQRLEKQRLSPLYVSVHATEQGIRNRLLGVDEQPSLLEKLVRLCKQRLSFHAQVVLVPGLNDGPHLDRTLSDLLNLGRAVLSVSVVPVGLTRYSPPNLRQFTQAEAKEIINQIDCWRHAYRTSLGRHTVYAADEWYLASGLPVPQSSYYEGFPQLENGIGLVRLFLDEWSLAKEQLLTIPKAPRTVVCGTLIAPVWRRIASEMNAMGAHVTILPVTNGALGESITVSGLLFAADVIDALNASELTGVAYLPRSMFNHEGTLTLDGFTLATMRAESRVPLAVASDAVDILRPLPS